MQIHLFLFMCVYLWTLDENAKVGRPLTPKWPNKSRGLTSTAIHYSESLFHKVGFDVYRCFFPHSIPWDSSPLIHHHLMFGTFSIRIQESQIQDKLEKEWGLEVWEYHGMSRKKSNTFFFPIKSTYMVYMCPTHLSYIKATLNVGIFRSIILLCFTSWGRRFRIFWRRNPEAFRTFWRVERSSSAQRAEPTWRCLPVLSFKSKMGEVLPSLKPTLN